MDHDHLVTDRVIGCAIEVHRALGPGLLERAYLLALCAELAHAGIAFERERSFAMVYRDVDVGVYIPDLIVEGKATSRSRASPTSSPYSRHSWSRTFVSPT